MNSIKKSVAYIFIVIVLFPIILPLNAQSLIKGPYLANPSDSSITVRWESDSKTNFLVEYGEDKLFRRSEAAEFVAQKKSGYLFEAKISSLRSGRKYFY